jgi:hypothetical protein
MYKDTYNNKHTFFLANADPLAFNETLLAFSSASFSFIVKSSSSSSSNAGASLLLLEIPA